MEAVRCRAGLLRLRSDMRVRWWGCRVCGRGWWLLCAVGEAADLVGEDWPQFPGQVVAEAGEDAEPCAVDGGGGAVRGSGPQDLVGLAMQDQGGHVQAGQVPTVPSGSALPCLRGGIAEAKPAVCQVTFDAFAGGGFVEGVARCRDGAVDGKAEAMSPSRPSGNRIRAIRARKLGRR